MVVSPGCHYTDPNRLQTFLNASGGGRGHRASLRPTDVTRACVLPPSPSCHPLHSPYPFIPPCLCSCCSLGPECPSPHLHFLLEPSPTLWSPRSPPVRAQWHCTGSATPTAVWPALGSCSSPSLLFLIGKMGSRRETSTPLWAFCVHLLTWCPWSQYPVSMSCPCLARPSLVEGGDRHPPAGPHCSSPSTSATHARGLS